LINDQQADPELQTIAQHEWKGHIMSECWALEKKENTKKSDMIVTKPGVLNKCPVVEKASEENDFKPFISECKVSLVGMNKPNSIKMLRDTRASQSLLVQSALPNSLSQVAMS